MHESVEVKEQTTVFFSELETWLLSTILWLLLVVNFPQQISKENPIAPATKGNSDSPVCSRRLYEVSRVWLSGLQPYTLRGVTCLAIRFAAVHFTRCHVSGYSVCSRTLHEVSRVWLSGLQPYTSRGVTCLNKGYIQNS